MTLRVRALTPGELTLRIQVLRDTAAYLGYVAAPDSAEDIIATLAEGGERARTNHPTGSTHRYAW